MLSAHSVEQIRVAEAGLAATLPAGALMARAARGLAEHLLIPAGAVVVMLIGPGNNGGDALYAAVDLLDRGVRVDLCLFDSRTVHTDGLATAIAAGARIVDAPTDQRFCVDALFGIGARPGLSGVAADWAGWARSNRPYVYSVDVPSGVDVDGATLFGTHFRADTTITFGTYKVALLSGPTAAVAGEVELVDLGIEPGPAVLESLDQDDRGLLVDLLRPFHDPTAAVHKYTRGVVGIAAGSAAYAGAAHLCVAGAQCGLAGMVRFVGSADLSARVVDRAPEIVAGYGRVQAWVVGPGGGTDAADHLAMALADTVPIVIDAAALAYLPDSFDQPALLTPHAGELAAMLGVARDAVEADPLGHARTAAGRWNATVLLKGARTLIAQSDRPTRVNRSGSPWLATAGSGDVLAGLAGALLAAGADPYDAGSLAALLHGMTAEQTNPGGPIIASDLAARLRVTIRDFLEPNLRESRV